MGNEAGPVVHVNGRSPIESGNILNLRFDGVDSETLVLFADAHGIAISAGSACRSREQKPSYVLKAMGLSDEEAMQSVRFSFSGMSNTMEEVKSAAIIIAGIVAKIIKQ